MVKGEERSKRGHKEERREQNHDAAGAGNEAAEREGGALEGRGRGGGEVEGGGGGGWSVQGGCEVSPGASSIEHEWRGAADASLRRLGDARGLLRWLGARFLGAAPARTAGTRSPDIIVWATMSCSIELNIVTIKTTTMPNSCAGRWATEIR